uniref:NlpC/P60 domain-containing protein n=1 Tax=Pyramimonas obovata TaxID=1411642 RepID=A0A7S0N743_9CHLO
MTEYVFVEDTTLFDSSECGGVATQASKGRHFKVIIEHSCAAESSAVGSDAVQIRLCEDNYECWLERLDNPTVCEPATTPYQKSALGEEEVFSRMPLVLQRVSDAGQKDNVYLWGGTLGPDLDCSGLMQWAFSGAGVWIPRDAYQQHEFTQPVPIAEARCGDLLFFGDATKVDHVGMVTEVVDAAPPRLVYTHSSGAKYGRNGIGRDVLEEGDDPVGAHYARRFLSAGRVVRNVTEEP